MELDLTFFLDGWRDPFDLLADLDEVHCENWLLDVWSKRFFRFAGLTLSLSHLHFFLVNLIQLIILLLLLEDTEEIQCHESH